MGRNDKYLYGKQNDAQPKRDSYPDFCPGEAQGERRQDQPHAQQQAAGVLPMLNTHDAHLPPFSLYENALMTMRGADRRREYEVSTLAKMVEACVRVGCTPEVGLV
jgi:hypothetical protein